jgi:hypothetical protein
VNAKKAKLARQLARFVISDAFPVKGHTWFASTPFTPKQIRRAMRLAEKEAAREKA